MKILIVQDYLRSGGTERQSVLLANACAAIGHDTVLVNFRPGGTLASTIAPNVRRKVLQPFDSRLDGWAPGLLAFARSIQPDIVLCMGKLANCRGASLQGSLPKAVVIGTMRTGKPLPPSFRISLHTVRHVVANSHEARANLIANYGVPAEKISVIHNSLVFTKTPEAGTREKIRAQLGADATTAVLLDVAMFRPEKNQRELVESAALLPAEFPWQLWLIGDGPARKTCEKLVEQKGLSDRVRFLGWQANPGPYYAAADIAVHASTSEALCNFLIEAQAQGLPAVAYNTQGISECFVPDKTGFAVAPGDRNTFCAKVVGVHRLDPIRKDALASEAQTFAREAFDADQQVSRYLALFATLLAQR